MDLINEMNKTVERIVQTISSREVAEMMEMKHTHLLEKIDKINETFNNRKIGSSKYWIKGAYKQAGNGKENREYQITKLGCEFLAHKSTGEKGIIFTDRYMTRFEEMEQVIKNNLNPYQGLSKELQAIFLVDRKQQENEKQINAVAKDLKDFKENAPLFNVECEELQKALKKKVVNLLGGKQSIAYRDNSVRQKAFIDIQHQIKREFAVNSYKGIKRIHFAKALEIIEDYRLPIALQEVVEVLNCQVSIQNVAKSDFYS